MIKMSLDGGFTWDDESVAFLSSLWGSQGRTLSRGQKDRIGIAYLTHILRVDELTIRGFLFGPASPNEYHAVGVRQSDVSKNDPNYAGFWGEVRDICDRRDYTDSLIRHLIASRDPWAVFSMMSNISPFPHRDSIVLREIFVNAHAYR